MHENVMQKPKKLHTLNAQKGNENEIALTYFPILPSGSILMHFFMGRSYFLFSLFYLFYFFFRGKCEFFCRFDCFLFVFIFIFDVIWLNVCLWPTRASSLRLFMSVGSYSSVFFVPVSKIKYITFCVLFDLIKWISFHACEPIQLFSFYTRHIFTWLLSNFRFFAFFIKIFYEVFFC